MNNQEYEQQPSLSLPELKQSSAGNIEQPGSTASEIGEKAASQNLETNQNGNASNPWPQIADDQSLAPQRPSISSVPVTNNPTASTPVPQIADEVDLIEKEWVQKAKEIIQRNLEDPYKQSEEIDNIKSDYKSKRFNH